MADLMLIYAPSVSVLHANTAAAQDWLDTHLDPEGPRLGDGYAIENRYMEAILTALDDEGFHVTLVRGH